MSEREPDDSERLRTCGQHPDPNSLEAARAEATKADDMLVLAWGLIANASGGDWKQETPEWQEAAARWRDRWLAAIRAPQPPEPEHTHDWRCAPDCAPSSPPPPSGPCPCGRPDRHHTHLRPPPPSEEPCTAVHAETGQRCDERGDHTSANGGYVIHHSRTVSWLTSVPSPEPTREEPR